jgi:hypothetical protein
MDGQSPNDLGPANASSNRDRKEIEAWENINVENAMQGNGTTLFEMGAV